MMTMRRFFVSFCCASLGAAYGFQASQDPDLNILLSNNCRYPVRFLWDSNIGGPSPNVLVLYNEWVSSSVSIVVEKAPFAGGRIYVISADDSNDTSTTAEALPVSELQDAITLMGQRNSAGLQSKYSKYMIPGEPRAWSGSASPPGQLVEFTEVNQGSHIYDADISNVFYFNGAVAVDMLYANGYTKIDKANCRNTTNPSAPDRSQCEKHGGVWIQYPSASHGPKGMCESPNIACIDGGGSACSKFDLELNGLFNFLNANKAATGYKPQLAADMPHSARVYTCDGFLNTPSLGFFLGSTCASICRGQCPMPTRAELSGVDAFKEWHSNKCGPVQFQDEDPSTWFVHKVRNPWAMYIRKTLGSSAYSFAQDEGPYGGNAQCHSTGAPDFWQAPTGMRITSCPDSPPAPPAPPSPTPPAPTPAPPAPPAPTPAPPQPQCNVGDRVYCPGQTRYRCHGAQCCQDGSTCPSAADTFHGCEFPKKVDCTKSSPTPAPPPPAPTPPPQPTCKVGDAVYCFRETSYRCAGSECCQDGSTCPSAPDDFHGCASPKTTDCTKGTPTPGPTPAPAPPAPPTPASPCLCVFDVDRTLTGKQGDLANCAGNMLVNGVPDTAYGGGTLTLSQVGQSIDGTFCKSCYFGVVSAGDASGPNSAERSHLMSVASARRQGGSWSAPNAHMTTGPLVLGCPDGLKQTSVRGILNWYKSKGVSIPDGNVHMFDDRANNISPFAGTGFNAHQVSCGLRDLAKGAIGLCGAIPAEIVPAAGVHLCGQGSQAEVTDDVAVQVV